MRKNLSLLVLCAVLAVPSLAAPSKSKTLDAALTQLTARGEFSGAVVIYDTHGIRFEKAYGAADPFLGRAFETDTSVDSASIAKPITATAVLLLASEGKIDLDAPVAKFVSEFPYAQITVRQLLSHSAGLPSYASLEPLANKTNTDFIVEMKQRALPLTFVPGSAFSYCNTCYNILALLVERVTGQRFIDFLHSRIGLPYLASIRPQSLADWRDRAIGYRRIANKQLERADSYEGEAFYGSANLSLSASALARWGSQWFTNLATVRTAAMSPVRIGAGVSGLTLGNWYCAPQSARCHYLGHHEGFHHMVYWDAERKLSIAMVTNNTLSPALHQRLQRAIVAFANGDSVSGTRELATPLKHYVHRFGSYRMSNGETLTLENADRETTRLTRGGVTYDVFTLGGGIGYAPGLDAYVTSSSSGNLHLLTLYKEEVAQPKDAP